MALQTNPWESDMLEQENANSSMSDALRSREEKTYPSGLLGLAYQHFKPQYEAWVDRGGYSGEQSQTPFEHAIDWAAKAIPNAILGPKTAEQQAMSFATAPGALGSVKLFEATPAFRKQFPELAEQLARQARAPGREVMQYIRAKMRAFGKGPITATVEVPKNAVPTYGATPDLKKLRGYAQRMGSETPGEVYVNPLLPPESAARTFEHEALTGHQGHMGLPTYQEDKFRSEIQALRESSKALTDLADKLPRAYDTPRKVATELFAKLRAGQMSAPEELAQMNQLFRTLRRSMGKWYRGVPQYIGRAIDDDVASTPGRIGPPKDMPLELMEYYNKLTQPLHTDHPVVKAAKMKRWNDMMAQWEKAPPELKREILKRSKP